MLTVHLHGYLEEQFGTGYSFEAKSVKEVIEALRANFDTFTEEFIKDERAYHILIDNTSSAEEECFLPLHRDSTIDIVPVISGSGSFLKALGIVVLGAALIWAAPALAGSLVGSLGIGATATAAATAAGTVATAIAGIGVSLIVAGVASLLYKEPKTREGGSSSNLGKGENIVGQGYPVPLGYGKFLIGSIVLSASYVSSKLIEVPAWTYVNMGTGTWQDTGYTQTGNTLGDDLYVEPYKAGGYVFNRGLTKAEAQFYNEFYGNTIGVEGTYAMDPATSKAYFVPIDLAKFNSVTSTFHELYIFKSFYSIPRYIFSRKLTESEKTTLAEYTNAEGTTYQIWEDNTMYVVPAYLLTLSPIRYSPTGVPPPEFLPVEDLFKGLQIIKQPRLGNFTNFNRPLTAAEHSYLVSAGGNPQPSVYVLSGPTAYFVSQSLVDDGTIPIVII
jgi:predicted phage tail protein